MNRRLLNKPAANWTSTSIRPGNGVVTVGSSVSSGGPDLLQTKGHGKRPSFGCLSGPRRGTTRASFGVRGGVGHRRCCNLHRAPKPTASNSPRPRRPAPAGRRRCWRCRALRRARPADQRRHRRHAEQEVGGARGGKARQRDCPAAIGDEARNGAEKDRGAQRLGAGVRSLPDAEARNGDSTRAPITMFQADTVSGLWRANSGFWTMLAEAVHSAAPRISNAPRSTLNPSPSPSAISPIPVKEMTVPSHASLVSARRATASPGPR